MFLILDYEDFKVYKDFKSDTYYAIEDNYLFEVVPILKMVYDVNSQDNINVVTCSTDFEGEQITDDNIIYWGFNKCCV